MQWVAKLIGDIIAGMYLMVLGITQTITDELLGGKHDKIEQKTVEGAQSGRTGSPYEVGDKTSD